MTKGKRILFIIDSIVTRVRSYGGVQRVKLFIITRVAYHEEWLVREIKVVFKNNNWIACY
jgi:hypothetical protein